MNLFSPIIPTAFRDQICIALDELAAQNASSRLGIAIKELSVFTKNYASKTPATLAFIYAFSSFEQEAVRLVTNIYLSVLEMRGFNVRHIPKSQIEYLNSIVLKILHKLPSVMANYKAFCKAHAQDFTEIGAKPALDNQLMDAYYKVVEANLKTSPDPFIQELIQLLVAHKLLTRTETSYDIEKLRFLFLFMALKLHSIVNVTIFFSAITKGQPDTGQFAAAINELITKTWPKALVDILKAVTPITAMSYQLMLKGDPSLLKDEVEVFAKFGIDTDTPLKICFNINSAISVDSTVICLNAILGIRDTTLKPYLLSLLHAELLSSLSQHRLTNLELAGFFKDLAQHTSLVRHRQEADIMINQLRAELQDPAPLQFATLSSPKRIKSTPEFNAALR